MIVTMLTYLLQIVLCMWWVVFMHELSHAMMVWRAGGTVKDFWVFPHTQNGKFYLGRVAYDNVPAENFHLVPYIYFAPVITSSAAFLALIVLNVVFWKTTVFLILMLFHLEDVGKWLMDYFMKREGTDGFFFRKYKEKNG